jgi:hypothetical protein
MESENQFMVMNLQGRWLLPEESTGTEGQTDSVTRTRLNAESGPSSIRSTSQLQRTWSARFVVAFMSKKVERVNQSRF